MALGICILTGRQFYACSTPQDSKCDFFLWADQRPDSNEQGGGGATWNENQQSRGTAGQATYSAPTDDNTVMCNCGQPAKS